jgi:hypothetical protein
VRRKIEAIACWSGASPDASLAARRGESFAPSDRGSRELAALSIGATR